MNRWLASELFDAAGRRLYLTREELVLAAAERAERHTRTFCLTLAYTGCRISEAPAVTAGRVDLEGRTLGKAAKAMAGTVAR